MTKEETRRRRQRAQDTEECNGAEKKSEATKKKDERKKKKNQLSRTIFGQKPCIYQKKSVTLQPKVAKIKNNTNNYD
ncbi:MAG: hypothetical protein IKO26_03475 [Paludibacteraceae bacterium]|nr:hypothetical protein [Paludibacteraceae bacterium]